MDIIYIPGSKPEKLLPKQDGTYTLRELQDLVKGKIDLIYLPDEKAYMIYNEKSKEKIYTYNPHATTKIKENYPNILI